jgi:hypothetical protein
MSNIFLKPAPIEEVATYFNELTATAVSSLNAKFARDLLAKKTRQEEPLPLEARQFSSYRTRMGTMLEYGLNSEIARLVAEATKGEATSTFVSANQYPDFYIRNKALEILYRIEMKAVDADSDEQAARFDVPTILIDEAKDLLLLIGWEWTPVKNASGAEIGEYPHVFASLVLPASHIAAERDARLEITGGQIIDGKVFVLSKKKGAMVPDPGNYGKFWRIVHGTRRSSETHNSSIQSFVSFLELVSDHTPRKRMRSRSSE